MLVTLSLQNRQISGAEARYTSAHAKRENEREGRQADFL